MYNVYFYLIKVKIIFYLQVFGRNTIIFLWAIPLHCINIFRFAWFNKGADWWENQTTDTLKKKGGTGGVLSKTHMKQEMNLPY